MKTRSGKFRNVWLAYNILADIDVAIKFYDAYDDKGIEAYRSEFKMAYRLHHPNLLKISHFDVYEKCPYLVMLFCANDSVSSCIGKFSEIEIWNFVLRINKEQAKSSLIYKQNNYIKNGNNIAEGT